MERVAGPPLVRRQEDGHRPPTLAPVQGQRGGHVEEIGRDVDIEPLHVVQVLEILAGDFGDGDVVNIDLLPADEVEQQVEWTFVPFELNLIGERGRNLFG